MIVVLCPLTPAATLYPFCPQTYAASLYAYSKYSDVDWAGCLDTYRSTIEYLVFLESNLIFGALRSKLLSPIPVANLNVIALLMMCWDSMVMLSSRRTMRSSLFLGHFFYCDNLSATYMAANPVFHGCTWNIELDYHLVWGKVALGNHIVCFVPFADQTAYLLTKALHNPHHALLCFKIVQPRSSSLGVKYYLGLSIYTRKHGLGSGIFCGAKKFITFG